MRSWKGCLLFILAYGGGIGLSTWLALYFIENAVCTDSQAVAEIITAFDESAEVRLVDSRVINVSTPSTGISVGSDVCATYEYTWDLDDQKIIYPGITKR